MHFSESKRAPPSAARRQSPLRCVGLLACALCLAMAASVAWAQTMDLVLVLDNSGSMRKNDPQFLLKPAVRGFVAELGDDTRVGMVVFDQGVRYPVALRTLDDEARAAIEKGLETVDYRGKFTDSAAAIERAIYELKSQGRDDAARVIVFMTDGIVDTGNAALDAERAKWLREDLAADAAAEGIRIFSVAFTEEADFFLTQSLARKSGGEYFRAAQPEDFAPVFATVRERVAALLAPAPAPAPAPASPVPAEAAFATTCLGRLDPEEREVLMEAAAAAGMNAEAMCAQMEEAAPGTVIVHAPPPAAATEQGSTLGLVVLLASAVLLLGVVLVAVLVLRRKGQVRPGEPSPAPARAATSGTASAAQVPEAYLKDVHGITQSGDLRLGARPLLIGRVAGSDPEHVDYFVVDQGTVGRRHALIQYRDFAFWISDQGSVNGTFVNGQRISSERQLRHGDRVMFHKYEFEFSMPELEHAEHTVFASAHDRTLVADATMVGAPVVAAAAAVAAARADDLDATAEGPDVQEAPSTPALWAERDETALSARAAADSAAALDAGGDASAAATDEGDFEADASAFFDDYPVPQTGETFHPGDPAVGSADDELVTVLPASAEDVEDVAADGDAPFTEAETLLPPAPYTEEDTAGGATAAEAEERLDEVSLDDFMATESFYRHAPVDEERADVTLMPDQVPAAPPAPLEDPVDDFFDITSDHPELPADDEDEDAGAPPRSRD